LVLLVPVLSAAQPLPVQAVGDALSQTVAQRLESSLRYQETVLQPGVVVREAYLHRGGRRYLLESSKSVPAKHLRTACWFTVEPYQGQLLLQPLQRYEDATTPDYTQPGTHYHTAQSFAEGELRGEETVLVKDADFEPATLLDPWITTRPAGHRFYVLDATPATRGDTLAAYTVQWADEDQTCLLTLLGRANPARRAWHGNQQPACTWQVDRRAKRVQATTVTGDTGNSWTRVYRGRNAFDESLYQTFTSPRGAGVIGRELVYLRRGRCARGLLRQERYTLPALNASITVLYNYL